MTEITEVNIVELKPAVYNPRIEMPVKEMKALKKSMVEFGCCEPVVINMNNTVIGGHQRIKAARELGWDKIPCIYLDLTPAKEKALNLALNKIRGDWDYEKLKDVLEELHGLEEIDFELTGFDESELKELISGDGGGKTDPDAIPEPPEEAITKPGDLWILGEHRLLCGDATKKEDVARLMDGEKADAVLTDPPYGIEQAGVPNDESEGHAKFMADAVNLLPVENAVIVAFQSTRTFPDWLDAIRMKGYKFERILSLYKEAQCTYPWRGWILKSESILVASVGNPKWQDVKPYVHDAYKVSEVSHEISDAIGWHGSIKPIIVITDILSRICPKDSIACDPFLGSGTTLIAAEQLGRKCFGMEIDPRYVDISVKRWEDFTGKTAHLQD